VCLQYPELDAGGTVPEPDEPIRIAANHETIGCEHRICKKSWASCVSLERMARFAIPQACGTIGSGCDDALV
jgi:hypothetical protein